MDELLSLKSQRPDLAEVVALIQRHMGVDATVVAELTADEQTYRAIAGDAASFNIALDATTTGPATYSHRLLSGQIPNVAGDVTQDERLANLPLLPDARVGAFVGVPLRLSDGTPYGTLCCLSHEPNHTLGGRDVQFLSMIAELIVRDLDEQHARYCLHTDLLELIQAESVNVAYQPIFEVHTNICLGVEALARFPDPFAAPDRTFAAADRVGLGLALEELVVRQTWDVLDQLGDSQFLALNLTPGSLLELAHRANMREEVPLNALVVEITEHTAIDAYAELRAELTSLRDRGLRLAVDDAGAGYASMRHILELQPDIVKIDRSLIHGLADDKARQTMVTAFVSLARELGATLVAEGVELPADYAALRELGVQAAQGYLLGRPSTDPHDLASWLCRGPKSSHARDPERDRHLRPTTLETPATRP